MHVNQIFEKEIYIAIILLPLITFVININFLSIIEKESYATTGIYDVYICTQGVVIGEATEWVNEIRHVYPDMDVFNVNIIGSDAFDENIEIFFKARFIRGEHTNPEEDIRENILEYMLMNEAFSIDTLCVIDADGSGGGNMTIWNNILNRYSIYRGIP